MPNALIALLALLLSLAAQARTGPDNVIYVTPSSQGNTGGSYACTAQDVPYPCCEGAGDAGGGTCGQVVNGADVCMGLEACSAAGGCRLQLPDGVITEAEFRIHGTRWWTIGTNTAPCGGNYPNGFPNGLVIQGKGIGNTILEATITGNATNAARADGDQYASSAVVRIALGGGLTSDEMPRVILQDFTIDGRREMQPYPTFGQYAYAPYSNVANDVPVKYQLIQRVRMENTTFHLSQIGNYQKTDPGKTTSGVVQVIDSEFYGGGCVQGYPAGPWGAERINGALPCGCERADAGDDCAGWGSHLSTPHTYVDDQQDEFPLLADWICFNEASGTSSCPGWTQQGGNIGVNSASTFLLASSSFDMGPHYLSGVGHTVPNSCTNGYQDIPATGPDVFSPRYCGTGWTAAKNHFYRSGSGAIDNHGSFKTVIKNNVFEGDCMDDQWGDAECKHLSFASSWVVDVQIRDNYFGGQDRRLGLVLDFWRPLPSERDPLTANIWQPVRVEGNTFELDCRLCGPTPQLCAPLTISPGSTNAEFLASDFADELPDVVLKDNVYVDTNAVNNCTGSVLASGYQRSGFNGQQNIRGLTVDGDVYLAGGVNGSADGAGFPGTSSANRNAAYFNYVTDLHLTNVTVNGTGSDGKITFGRSAGADDMAGGCFDPPTFNNACAVEADCLQNRYGLTTPCP